MNGTRVNNAYKDSGFRLSEESVLKENNMKYFNKIVSKVPNFTPAMLTLNNFTLYYRSYPKWELKCQTDFNTEYV